MITHFIILTTLLVTVLLQAQDLDSIYHSPAEIEVVLAQFQDDYPDWVRVDSIGHSSEYGYPILMAKLSDNPDDNEPEPALLYIGQVHAEEVLGVETTLEVMRLMLETLEDDDMRARLEGLELYFIPTANPEGLEVVISGTDITLRKNCRDNIGDGEFRFREGAGWDTSGVDLNRNFGLHWDRGDTLFQFRDPPYIYNYYRGPAPFSEPEARALRDLGLAHRFPFSISYHSSRSGRNAERIIAPWYWDARWPPDRDAINALGDTLASMIPTADGEGFYTRGNFSQRLGQSSDWFYQRLGTFQYIIEISAEIQPDSAGRAQIIQDNLEAAFFFMDLALGNASITGFGILSIVAVDAESGSGLECTITVDDVTDPVLEPRKTSELTGRFDWLLPEGSHSVTVTRFGYRPFQQDEFEIAQDEINLLEIELERLSHFRQRFNVTDAGTNEAVDGRFIISDHYEGRHEFELVRGEAVTELPTGYYDYLILVDGYLPAQGSMQVRSDSSFHYELFAAGPVYEQDFDEDPGWQRGGNLDDWGLARIDDRSILTESLAGAYGRDIDTWLALETDVELDSAHGTSLELIHRPYFEPGRDFGLVEYYHAAQGEWIVLKSFSQFPDGWDTLRLNLDDLAPAELTLRFRVTTDNRVEEDGWLIDKLTIYRTEEPYLIEPESPLPADFKLSVYPNPFNSVTLAVLDLSREQVGEVAIFSAVGRRIATLHRGRLTAGSHRYLIDGGSWASGVYYLRYRSDAGQRLTRLTCLK